MPENMHRLWARRVRAVLDRNRWSYARFAELLDVDVRSVSNWARGRNVPIPRNQQMIQEYLELDQRKEN